MNTTELTDDTLAESGPENRPATMTDPATFWENVAETRWGQYVTEIERRAVLAAEAACGRPGVGLEIGCEGGRWCRLLCERGWTMIGTDTNADALRLCQQRNESVQCIHVAPQQETFPVESRSIDLLLCIEVSVINRPWFLDEAQRALMPGGVFVGSFNNLFSWRGVASNAKSKFNGTDSYYHASYSSFRRSLRGHGFTVVEEQGYCWPPFGRKSDSAWVPVGAKLERWTGVQRMPILSPWIIFTAALR
ncbi:MAG: class I SAM-dependent methyltransferase [Pirellulales bacterium]